MTKESKSQSNLSIIMLAAILMLGSCTSSGCYKPGDDGDEITSIQKYIYPINVNNADISSGIDAKPTPNKEVKDFNFPWQSLEYNKSTPNSQKDEQGPKEDFYVYKGKKVSMTIRGEVNLAGYAIQQEVPFIVRPVSYNDGTAQKTIYSSDIIPTSILGVPGSTLTVTCATPTRIKKPPKPEDKNKKNQKEEWKEIPSIGGVELTNCLGMYVVLIPASKMGLSKFGDSTKWTCTDGLPFKNIYDGDNVIGCADTIDAYSCNPNHRAAYCSGQMFAHQTDKGKDFQPDSYEKPKWRILLQNPFFLKKDYTRYQVQKAWGEDDYLKGTNVNSGTSDRDSSEWVKTARPANISRKCTTLYSMPWSNLSEFAMCTHDYKLPNWATNTQPIDSHQPQIAQMQNQGPVSRWYFTKAGTTCKDIDEEFNITEFTNLYGGFYNYVLTDSQVYWAEYADSLKVTCDQRHGSDHYCTEHTGSKKRKITPKVCPNNPQIELKWPLQIIAANIPLVDNDNAEHVDNCKITLNSSKGQNTLTMTKDKMVSSEWQIFPTMLEAGDKIKLNVEKGKSFFKGHKNKCPKWSWTVNQEIFQIYSQKVGKRHCETGMAYAIKPLTFVSCFNHYRSTCSNSRVPHDKCIESIEINSKTKERAKIGSCAQRMYDKSDRSTPIDEKPLGYKDLSSKKINSLIKTGRVFSESENVEMRHCSFCLRKDLDIDEVTSLPIVKDSSSFSDLTNTGKILSDSDCIKDPDHSLEDSYFDEKTQQIISVKFTANSISSVCPDSSFQKEVHNKLNSLTSFTANQTTGVNGTVLYGGIFSNSGGSNTSSLKIPDLGQKYVLAVGYAGNGRNIESMFTKEDQKTNTENNEPRKNILSISSGVTAKKGEQAFLYIQEFKKDISGQYLQELDPNKHPSIVFGEKTSHDEIARQINLDPSLPVISFESIDSSDGDKDGMAEWKSGYSGKLWIGILDTTPQNQDSYKTDGNIVTLDRSKETEVDDSIPMKTDSSLQNVLYYNTGRYRVVARTKNPSNHLGANTDGWISRSINVTLIEMIKTVFFGKKDDSPNAEKSCTTLLRSKKKSEKEKPIPKIKIEVGKKKNGPDNGYVCVNKVKNATIDFPFNIKDTGGCATCKIPVIPNSSNRIIKSFHNINIVYISAPYDSGIPKRIDHKKFIIKSATNFSQKTATLKTDNGRNFTAMTQSDTYPDYWYLGGYFRGKGSITLGGKQYSLNHDKAVYNVLEVQFIKRSGKDNIEIEIKNSYSAVNWKERVKESQHSNDPDKQKYGDDIGAYFDKNPTKLSEVSTRKKLNDNTLLYWEGYQSNERGIQDIETSYVDQENVLLQQIPGSNKTYCTIIKGEEHAFECENTVYATCKSGIPHSAPYIVEPGTKGHDITICNRKNTSKQGNKSNDSMPSMRFYTCQSGDGIESYIFDSINFSSLSKATGFPSANPNQVISRNKKIELCKKTISGVDENLYTDSNKLGFTNPSNSIQAEAFNIFPGRNMISKNWNNNIRVISFEERKLHLYDNVHNKQNFGWCNYQYHPTLHENRKRGTEEHFKKCIEACYPRTVNSPVLDHTFMIPMTETYSTMNSYVSDNNILRDTNLYLLFNTYKFIRPGTENVKFGFVGGKDAKIPNSKCNKFLISTGLKQRLDIKYSFNEYTVKEEGDKIPGTYCVTTPMSSPTYKEILSQFFKKTPNKCEIAIKNADGTITYPGIPIDIKPIKYGDCKTKCKDKTVTSCPEQEKIKICNLYSMHIQTIIEDKHKEIAIAGPLKMGNSIGQTHNTLVPASEITEFGKITVTGADAYGIAISGKYTVFTVHPTDPRLWSLCIVAPDFTKCTRIKFYKEGGFLKFKTKDMFYFKGNQLEYRHRPDKGTVWSRYGLNSLTFTYDLPSSKQLTQCLDKSYKDSSCWTKITKNSNPVTDIISYPYGHIIDEDFKEDSITPNCDLSDLRPLKYYSNCRYDKEKYKGARRELTIETAICDVTRTCNVPNLNTTQRNVRVPVYMSDTKGVDKAIPPNSPDIRGTPIGEIPKNGCKANGYVDKVEYYRKKKKIKDKNGKEQEVDILIRKETQFDCVNCKGLTFNNKPVTYNTPTAVQIKCKFIDRQRAYCENSTFLACKGDNISGYNLTNKGEEITVCNKNSSISTIETEVLDKARIKNQQIGFIEEESMKANGYTCKSKQTCLDPNTGGKNSNILSRLTHKDVIETLLNPSNSDLFSTFSTKCPYVGSTPGNCNKGIIKNGFDATNNCTIFFEKASTYKNCPDKNKCPCQGGSYSCNSSNMPTGSSSLNLPQDITDCFQCYAPIRLAYQSCTKKAKASSKNLSNIMNNTNKKNADPVMDEEFEIVKVCKEPRKWEEGVVYSMFHAMTTGLQLQSIIYIALILILTLKGFGIVMGTEKLDATSILKELLNIGIIFAFFNVKSWNMYQHYIAENYIDFIDGINKVLIQSLDPRDVNGENIFGPIDTMFDEILLKATTWYRILAILISDFTGFIFVIAILFCFFAYILMFTRAVVEYLSSLIMMCMYISFGPIFFIFKMHPRTSSYFNNWWKGLLEMAVAQFYLVSVFALFTILFINIVEAMLFFEICYRSLITIPVVNISLLGWWTVANSIPANLKPYFANTSNVTMNSTGTFPTFSQLAVLLVIIGCMDKFLTEPLFGGTTGLKSFFGNISNSITNAKKTARNFAENAVTFPARKAADLAVRGTGYMAGKAANAYNRRKKKSDSTDTSTDEDSDSTEVPRSNSDLKDNTVHDSAATEKEEENPLEVDNDAQIEEESTDTETGNQTSNIDRDSNIDTEDNANETTENTDVQRSATEAINATAESATERVSTPKPNVKSEVNSQSNWKPKRTPRVPVSRSTERDTDLTDLD